MTQKRILELAWQAQIQIWSREHDILIDHPDDIIARYKEEKAYRELREIEKMMDEIK